MYTTASISSYNNIFAFNPDDYSPSKVKKAAQINTEYIDPMRVFYPPSKASPFCACGTHTLPDETPAMSDAWGRDPVDSLRNSLAKLTPEVDDPPPFFLGYPAWYCDPSLRIAPTPLNSSTLEKGRTLYATGGGVALNGEEEEDDEDDEWHDAMSTSEAATLLSSATELDSFARAGTRVIVPLQKNTELSSTLSMFGAPAEIQEAHWLYHQTFADKAQAPRVVLADLIEMNLRRTAMVGLLKMKTTLKQMTIMTFKDIFKVVSPLFLSTANLQMTHLFGQRSDIWKVVECSAHPNQCSCGYYLTSLHLDGDGLGDGSSYGHPARRLGAFAGALFALDILSFSDFRTCIDILRTKTGCVAAQALHAAVLHAGDKVCKTKNREYMLELAEEQRRRLSMSWIESDRGARDLLNVSRSGESTKMKLTTYVSSSKL